MASIAPTKQRAIPMQPRDPRLFELLVHDYPLTTAWAGLVMYVSLILAVLEAVS